MKAVQFCAVAVGDWFKESEAGVWQLKTSSNAGMYQHFGTRYEPRFKTSEIVFVE